MDLSLILGALGIIFAVLFYIIELFGQKEFIQLAFNIGIIIKRMELKVKPIEFNRVCGNLYIKNRIYYKFIKNDICLVRYKMAPWYSRVYIPMYTYKITIENNKYIVKLKMPMAHLIFFLCHYLD
jgi:hypothetical protein